MNHRLRDAAPVPSFPQGAALDAWLDNAPDFGETDLDAVLLCHRVRRDGCIGIVEVFDAD
jgi:hypothetical protein